MTDAPLPLSLRVPNHPPQFVGREHERESCVWPSRGPLTLVTGVLDAAMGPSAVASRRVDTTSDPTRASGAIKLERGSPSSGARRDAPDVTTLAPTADGDCVSSRSKFSDRIPRAAAITSGEEFSDAPKLPCHFPLDRPAWCRDVRDEPGRRRPGEALRSERPAAGGGLRLRRRGDVLVQRPPLSGAHVHCRSTLRTARSRSTMPSSTFPTVPCSRSRGGSPAIAVERSFRVTSSPPP